LGRRAREMIKVKGKQKPKTETATVDPGRLKSFFDRIEKLDEERKAIGEDIRDIYTEAKGIGYDTKIMRKVYQLRSMDAADRAEQETLVDVYKHALGMENDGLEAQADARAMKLAREVDQALRLSNGQEPPRIDAIMRDLGCSSGKASKIRQLCEERMKGGVSFSSPEIAGENETVEA
jgi:uncharacterized protein (UPF0335 family)